MDELISVIVPLYNVQKYLSKCVESILHQTYYNLQILLIDDGSTDGSGKICDEYARKDSRVEVIHKVNGGQSTARNEGLRHAKGNYIAFVDSDDILNLEMFEKLYKLIKKFDTDISFCKLKPFFEDEAIDNNADTKSYCESVLTKQEALKEILINPYVGNYIMIKLWKKELWNDIFFPENKVYEDVATVYKIVNRANKVAYTTQELYYYLTGRNGATTNTFTEEKIKDSLEAYHGQYQFIIKYYPELLKIASLVFCRMYTSAMEKICIGNYDEMFELSEVTEKYEDFLKAFQNIDCDIMKKYLEPYRMISVIILSHGIESYRFLFETLYNKIKKNG